ncbi:carbonic anhydrase [Candidatus Woesearchaeota archaeon]|nr:carbonic anhydrase [Candidatus Woesearchaeota archaeon]
MASGILKEIFNDNKIFTGNGTKRYNRLKDKQSPDTTLIVCSDSRVPTCVVSKDTVNKVFCIENIGNQIITSEGSVDYGVLHLKTKLLLVLGHTNCGAVNACFSDFSKESSGIQKELETMSDGLAEIDSSFDKDDPERLNKYAEANVDFQVSYAVDKYNDKVKSGELTVVGMMMDFTDSYSDKRCGVFITNINGETDSEKIKDMDVLKDIDEQVKKTRIKRIS